MTWVAVAVAVSAAIGVTSAVASGRQQQAAAQSQANMDDYNAKMADIQARQANAAAGREEDAQRRQARAVMGQQLAASAEAGAGLNGDLLRQSIFDSESDTQAIRYEGALKAQGLYDQASIARSSAAASRSQGRAAMDAGYLNAAGALTSSATTYYGTQQKIAAAKKAS